LRVYRGIDEFDKVPYPVVTVGTFDGLHIGHQKIIKRMSEIAGQNGGGTILITFDPHPRIVLNNNHGKLRFISTQKRKFHLLEQFGIDHMIVVPFTLEFAKTPSEVFVKQYIVDKIKARKLIVGYDHHFGRNREGNYFKLIEMGRSFGFEVEEIPAQYVDDIPVSSTKIRKALGEGNVKLANRMLGYEYSITGIVIDGNKLGRTIGFRTANIDVEDHFKLIAAGGVYACKVEIDGQIFSGMGNIGKRPTVGSDHVVTEVHIFEFDREIYGKEITLFFIDRIRDEQKFENLDKLREQLTRDKAEVERILKRFE
jgi:riboflavin kinase/FMN adenylyltransferase